MIPPEYRETSINSHTRIITLQSRVQNIDETVQRLRRSDELRGRALTGLSGDIAEIINQYQKLANNQKEIISVCHALEERIQEGKAAKQQNKRFARAVRGALKTIGGQVRSLLRLTLRVNNYVKSQELETALLEPKKEDCQS